MGLCLGGVNGWGKSHNPILTHIQRPFTNFNLEQIFILKSIRGITMKLIKTNFEASLREGIDAWLDENKVKLREIQHREDLAKARRSMFKLINCKCRV
jgi:hypothetical protein